MRHRILRDAPPRSWALVLDKGDDPIQALTRFANAHALAGATFTGLGAFERAEVAFFDRATMEYAPIPVPEQVEVLTITGNVALAPGGRKIHAHVVLSRPDGSTIGGHLVSASVWPTLEVVLDELAAPLHRVRDDETGLPLLEP